VLVDVRASLDHITAYDTLTALAAAGGERP
jgi:hypothetical protein